MASSMTQQSGTCTVKSLHKGNIGGQAVTVVSCRVTSGTNKSNVKPIFGNGVDTSDIAFVLSGSYTAPAVGDTFTLVLN